MPRNCGDDRNLEDYENCPNCKGGNVAAFAYNYGNAYSIVCIICGHEFEHGHCDEFDGDLIINAEYPNEED